MKNEQKILSLINKNSGFITSSDLKNEGISRVYLTRMVNKGIIIRISRGNYGLPNSMIDEYHQIMSKSKNSIFSITTALYLHDLSDRTPLVYDVSVPSYYGGSLSQKDYIHLYYDNKEVFGLGLMWMQSPFNSMIRVYDMERTICDIVKMKDKLDKELFSNALKTYITRKDKDLNKLYKYSKVLKIEKKITEYLEVLL